jgi:hypothetical protein
MTYQNKDMTGQIYINSNIKSERSPSHGGSIMINGVDHWFKGWAKAESWEMKRIVISPKNAGDSKNDGVGVISLNTAKKDAQEADFGGFVNVDGQKYWLNCWLNEDQNGNPYLSVVVKERKKPSLTASAQRSESPRPHPAVEQQRVIPANDEYELRITGDSRWL